MAKSTKRSVGRRGFLKGAAAGAAVLAAKPRLAHAQERAQQPETRGAPAPSGATVARETGAARPAGNARIIENPGSDFMVDVLKTLNIEYLGSNPGSTFESLHESLINYGDNKMPEFLTCTHEECSLAEGEMLAGTTITCFCHGSEFDVRSGKVLAPPAVEPVKVYRTRIIGDAVEIEV